MGGGLLPHTFPQLLGAASVFLANLSECESSLLRLPLTSQTSLEGSSSPKGCSTSSDELPIRQSTGGFTPFQLLYSLEDSLGLRAQV